MTDPNLLKIAESNKKKSRSIKKTIEQARDYLSYILGHDIEKADNELSKFIAELKNSGDI